MRPLLTIANFTQVIMYGMDVCLRVSSLPFKAELWSLCTYSLYEYGTSTVNMK